MKTALLRINKTDPNPKLLAAEHWAPTIHMILTKAFYILFCLAFTIVIGGVVFANDAGFSPAILLLLIAFNVVAILLSVYRILGLHSCFVARYYNIIVASGLVLLFGINVIMGYILRFAPVFDLGAIFTGAKEWAMTGSFMDHMDPTCGTNYFITSPTTLEG
jgi:hypothetical protein